MEKRTSDFFRNQAEEDKGFHAAACLEQLDDDIRHDTLRL